MKCRVPNTVGNMETIHAQNQIETLHTRMRLIREARHLTLKQSAKLSKGEISAIALGSYERGDRSVSAHKLITIANLYEVPISELFEDPRSFFAGGTNQHRPSKNSFNLESSCTKADRGFEKHRPDAWGMEWRSHLTQSTGY